LLDRNLRYVSLNRRLAQMNGAPIAAHLGRPITELVPDLYPQLEPFLRRALAGEAIPSFEVQRPNFEAGGGYRTLMLSYQPARDEAGEVVGVSIAVTDVSERKRIQQVLDETEEHYRSMLELNPQMPWVMDPEGKIIEVSPRLEEMTGLAREQLLGFGWLNMLHPDDMPAVRQALHSAIASGQSTDVQYRIRCRNGEWRWVRSRGYPRLDSSGKIVCRYGGLEDIQEQKQTQDALQACRAELRAISDAVPFGVVLAHAPEGNIVLANPAAKQWFGDAILPGQVIADYGRWGAFCADGQRLKPEEYPLACALLRGETTRMEKVFLRRADGTSIGAALSGVPVHSEDGRTIGGIMLIEEQGAEEKKE
jgi:PAS domain S-box-containing protein